MNGCFLSGLVRFKTVCQKVCTCRDENVERIAHVLEILKQYPVLFFGKKIDRRRMNRGERDLLPEGLSRPVTPEEALGSKQPPQYSDVRNSTFCADEFRTNPAFLSSRHSVLVDALRLREIQSMSRCVYYRPGNVPACSLIQRYRFP